LHFLRILEIYKKIGNLNQFEKEIKSVHSARLAFSAQGLGQLPQPNSQISLAGTSGAARRVVTALSAPAAARSVVAHQWARCSRAAAQAPGRRGHPAKQGGVAKFSPRQSANGEGRRGGAQWQRGLHGGRWHPKGAPAVREDHGP
jgi:hypothetical protein